MSNAEPEVSISERIKSLGATKAAPAQVDVQSIHGKVSTLKRKSSSENTTANVTAAPASAQAPAALAPIPVSPKSPRPFATTTPAPAASSKSTPTAAPTPTSSPAASTPSTASATLAAPAALLPPPSVGSPKPARVSIGAVETISANGVANESLSVPAADTPSDSSSPRAHRKSVVIAENIFEASVQSYEVSAGEKPPARSGGTFQINRVPFSQSALAALAQVKEQTNLAIMLTINVDLNVIDVTKKASCEYKASAIGAFMSTEEPAFYILKGVTDIAFIYSCPEVSLRLARKLYLTTKASVLEIIAQEGVELTVKMEASGPDDVTDGDLEYRPAFADDESSQATLGPKKTQVQEGSLSAFIVNTLGKDKDKKQLVLPPTGAY